MKFKTFLLSFFVCSLASANCTLNLKQEELKDYNYILVPGIFNEVIPFYLTEHRYFLLEQGVPDSQIIRVNNSSFVAPEEEALRIDEALAQVQNKKKFIFLAHSKGALESLYFFKKFGLDRLERAFLIQGPFDGVAAHRLAYLMDDKEKSSYMLNLLKYGAGLSYVVSRFEKYSQENVRKNLLSVLNEKLVSKLSFIRTKVQYEELSFRFKFLGSLYQDHFGEVGDGVLLFEEQKPYGLEQFKGFCIKDLKSDHGGLVKAAPWEYEKKEKIYSFMEELLGFKRDE